MNILAGLEFRRIEIYRISSQWLFAHPVLDRQTYGHTFILLYWVLGVIKKQREKNIKKLAI